MASTSILTPSRIEHHAVGLQAAISQKVSTFITKLSEPQIPQFEHHMHPVSLLGNTYFTFTMKSL